MIGLLLIFFIGKAFFNLADKHGQNKWLFAILGVAVYYGMTFVAGLIIGFVYVAMGNEGISDSTAMLLGLLGIPVGLLAVWLFHHILRKNWEANSTDPNSELLDSSDF